MSLVEGLKLVRRCTKGDRLARLRKSRIKMADVVANMALVSAMIHPITEEAVLHDMIEEWYNLHPDTQVLFRLLKNMMINAVSSQHIYLLGQLLVEKNSCRQSQHLDFVVRDRLRAHSACRLYARSG
ncbi:hypothetical protein J6590_091871 [Homalodisca vitripennis]|nr:hypothetical protein J6590_091871 [Homalodisca vitripennis]